MISDYTAKLPTETVDDRVNAINRYFSPPHGENNLQQTLEHIGRYLSSLGFYDGVVADIASETLFILLDKGIKNSEKRMFIGDEPTSHFYCFLFGIARNVSDHYIRASYKETRIKTRKRNRLRENNNGGTDPYELVVNSEVMEILEQATDELPPYQRIVTKLIYLEGIKNREIARRLDKGPKSTTMVWIRSKKNIEKILQERGLNKSYFFYEK